jgi:hypothetical protein
LKEILQRERDTMAIERIVCKERVGGEGTILATERRKLYSAIEKKPGFSFKAQREK